MQEVPLPFLAWLLYRKIISPRPVYSCSDHKPSSSSANPQAPALANESSLVISGVEESLYLQRACYLAVCTLGADKAFLHLTCSTGEELKQQLLSNKLAMSAYCGYAEDVQSILAQGFKTDPKSILGSPLCAAAAGNHKEIVAFLLGQGFSPNNHRKEGPTALWVSCLNGHHKIVQLLLLSPTIKVNERHRKKTPLAIAAEKGHTGIMRTLFARPDLELDLEGTGCPLMGAMMGDQAAAVHLLVDRLQFPSRDAVEYYNLLLWGAVDQNKSLGCARVTPVPPNRSQQRGLARRGWSILRVFSAVECRYVWIPRGGVRATPTTGHRRSKGGV